MDRGYRSSRDSMDSYFSDASRRTQQAQQGFPRVLRSPVAYPQKSFDDTVNKTVEEKNNSGIISDMTLGECKDSVWWLWLVIGVLITVIVGLCIWFFILKKPEVNLIVRKTGGKKKKKKHNI